MFGKNAKVDLELNRDVEQLIKTGGKEKLLPIVQAGEPVLRQRTVAYNASFPSVRSPNSSIRCTPPCWRHPAWGSPPPRSAWGSRSPWSKTTCATTRMIRAKSRNSPST
mgnify:CR=1 FL=1